MHIFVFQKDVRLVLKKYWLVKSCMHWLKLPAPIYCMNYARIKGESNGASDVFYFINNLENMFKLHFDLFKKMACVCVNACM